MNGSEASPSTTTRNSRAAADFRKRLDNPSVEDRAAGDQLLVDMLRNRGYQITPPADMSALIALNRETPETRLALSKKRADRRANEILAAEEAQADLERIPSPTLLAALLAEPDEPVVYRVDQLLPSGGRVLFYGPRKAGKSSIEQDLIRCLVDGAPFLGRYDVEPVSGNVGLIDNELNRGQLRRWLRDKGIARTTRVSVFPIRGNVASFNILDESVRAAWAQTLKQAGISVLILDCLRPVLDALGLDENHDGGRFLVAFDALLAEADVDEAIIVHHTGHAGDRARGDSRLMDWPDALWRLGTDRPDDPFSARYFSAFGRDVAEPERRLTYDAQMRRLTAGTTRQGAALEPAVEVVLDVVRDSDTELSFRAVQDRAMTLIDDRGLEIARARIREAIDHLSLTGQLRHREGRRGARMFSLLDQDEHAIQEPDG